MQTSAEQGFENAVVLSPSQIATWRGVVDGRRAWAHRYIAKRKGPEKASAALGTASHAQLERHLRGHGFDYSTEYQKRAAEIAILGVHLFPAPCTPGMRVENLPIGAQPGGEHDRNFRFEDSNGIVWQGRMDVTVEDSAVVPGLWGGAPACLDLKTSSNIAKYALKGEDLHTDPAAVIYAYYLMGMYRSSVADLQWVYVPTRGPKVAVPARMRVYQPRVVDEFGKLRDTGKAIRRVLETVRDPLDLPSCEGTEPRGSGKYGDPCAAYGGCPYKEFCTDVFDRFGFAIATPVTGTTPEYLMNGTPVGQALMQQLVQDAAPPDPAAQAAAFASWQQQQQFLAWQASQAAAVPVAPPPVVSPEAVPSWALATTPYTGAAPTVAAPAINPPGEYRPPPTLEQRAAVLAPFEKTKRARRTKEGMKAARAAAGQPEDTRASLYTELSEIFERLAALT